MNPSLSRNHFFRASSLVAVGIGLALTLLLTGCQAPQQSLSWRATLHRDLPLYADQSRPGVETVVTHHNMFTVLKYVLAGIQNAPNIRAQAYTDEELNYVTDTQAPGISAYRAKLYAMLAGIPHFSRLHIQSIHRLNKDGKIFNILILKTNLTMPYTSVFIHLKCGYWTNADETALRKAMASAQAN
jgi:hypothetical protein